MTVLRSALLIVAVAALTFAACGSDDPAGDAPTGTVAGPAMRAPTPIEVTGGGADAVPARTAELGTAAAISSEMLIAPWVAEYVVVADLPALPTNDIGFVYDGTATVAPERVAELAAALGVGGSAERVDDGFSMTWRVGPDDGSAPTVWVYEDAQLSWNYNSSRDDDGRVSTCTVSIDADGTQIESCDDPEPPMGVPTADEAEQLVSDTLVALGEDPDALEFEVHADKWSATVSVTEPVGSGNGGRYWNFGFGGEAVMQWAGGTLATPEAVGPYPLVDLDTAITRLNDRSGWMADVVIAAPVGGGAIAVAEPAQVESAEPVPVDVVEGDVEGDVDDEPLIPVEPGDEGLTPAAPLPEPMPVPEPVTVTLVDVQPDLWWAWDTDGSIWLLPAYRFVDTDGGRHTVAAVAEEFLIFVDPPMPVDPPTAVEPDPGVAVEPGEPPHEPNDRPLADSAQLEEFVGSTLADFEEAADAFGYTTRVVELDGEALAVTEDYSLSRVNVVVADDTVTAIASIG